MVRQGHGHSGANPDYVVNTVKAIEDLGFRDADLHWLAAQLS
jgi:cation transport protein ChaC